MKKEIFLISILGLFFTSCATNSPKKDYWEEQNYEFLKDSVTVSTLLRSTKMAYVRGCFIEKKEQGQQKGASRLCAQKADEFIDKEVLYFLKDENDLILKKNANKLPKP